MKKIITLFTTLLFFASVTVFTLPMMQDDGNADLPLTEKVTIMANAGDGGNGDEDDPHEQMCWSSWTGGLNILYHCPSCTRMWFVFPANYLEHSSCIPEN